MPSSELAPLPPLPQARVSSPFYGSTRLRVRGVRGLGEPVQTTGGKAWHSVECSEQLHCYSSSSPSIPVSPLSVSLPVSFPSHFLLLPISLSVFHHLHLISCLSSFLISPKQRIHGNKPQSSSYLFFTSCFLTRNGFMLKTRWPLCYLF